MKNRSRNDWVRLGALVLTGGALFQATGCATTLAPLALSYAESSILTALLGVLI